MDIDKAIEILSEPDSFYGIKYINGVETGYLSPHAKSSIALAIQALEEKKQREFQTCKNCKYYDTAPRISCCELSNFALLMPDDYCAYFTQKGIVK